MNFSLIFYSLSHSLNSLFSSLLSVKGILQLWFSRCVFHSVFLLYCTSVYKPNFVESGIYPVNAHDFVYKKINCIYRIYQIHSVCVVLSKSSVVCCFVHKLKPDKLKIPEFEHCFGAFIAMCFVWTWEGREKVWCLHDLKCMLKLNVHLPNCNLVCVTINL